MPHQSNTFYSEEAQEIMGRMPSRLIRWGLASIFFVFLLLLGICFFIRYPRTVSGPVTIDRTTATGRMVVSSHHLREIRSGQPVRIELYAYPRTEYGILRGEVSQLSPVPGQIGQYEVVISLPGGLRTAQGQELHSFPLLNGTAEIVIANPRLIKRLISPFAHR